MRFSPRREWPVLLGILVVAGVLRLYRLDQLPPGLHYDEAFNVVKADQVIAGTDRPILFRENFTEEPMMIYATAVSFILFGSSPWALRLVSAVAGLATVAALYLLARALFAEQRTSDSGQALARPFGFSASAGALVSTAVLAILYWHVNFSRLGMEPILLPLMLTLSLAFLWRGYRSGRVLDFVIGGVFLGGTQYTYKGALFVPLLLALAIGIEILVNRGFWTRFRVGLVVFVATSVLVFSPLGLYFATHPDEFFRRPAAVTVASSGPETLLGNAIRVAGMFFVRGDENPRSNLPGRPALDPILALGFVAGLGVCLARIRRPESRFLLIWLGVMVLPSVFTDYAPHFGRTIGAIPALALVAGSGLAEMRARIRAPRPVLTLAVLAALATSTAFTFRDYFGDWSERTDLFDAFDVGLLSLAGRLRERPATEMLYMSPVHGKNYTVQYGLAGRSVSGFDGRQVLVLPPAGQSAAYGIVTREDRRSLRRLTRIFPHGRIVDRLSDFAGGAYASVFVSEGTARIHPQRVVDAELGKSIRLWGYDVTREGNKMALTLYWRALAEMHADYTVFIHLIGPPNPATGTPIWAQEDARPGHGYYPTHHWRTNEVILDDYHLAVPQGAPSGQYQIEVGMYTLTTGARLAVTDAKGARMENDRVLFEANALP